MRSLPLPPSDLLVGAALFLDFDGTLTELAETPDAIRVAPGLGPLLGRLRDRLNGRIAIVSGRSLQDLERHVPASGLAFSGSHGLELRLANGTSLPLQVPPEIHGVRDRVRHFAADRHGLLVEDKPAGVALHYRQAPDEGRRVSDFMEMLARQNSLIVQHGNMVVELRPHGADKGDAVRIFMREPEFAGARPVFIGDDLTDEHAFSAVESMGGSGILVGQERVTAAKYRLPSVAAVAEWLEACA
jgi:trehalose 6-phosphate phosphatase